MLKWAAIFAVVAVATGVLGFTDVVSGTGGIAQLLFVVFLVLFIAVVLYALFGVSRPTKR